MKDDLRDALIARRMMGDSFQVGLDAGSIAQNPAHGLAKMNVEVNFLNHLVEMFGQFLDRHNESPGGRQTLRSYW